MPNHPERREHGRGRVHVGCSGWSYDDWRGIVYPDGTPKRRWFEHYTSMFDTVELNSTFYRLPSPETASAWGAQAPPGFVFALKLGQFGSHRKKLIDAVTWLPNHVERAQRLGRALGPTLVQLPPRWRRDVARLDEFLSVAPRSMRWAVELREPTWLHDDVFDVLRRHGAALCVHDMLPCHPWIRTTNWSYVRYHGPDAPRVKYRGRYGPARLERDAAVMSDWLDDGDDLYAYFNNDYGGEAVHDALWLAARLAVHRLASPAT